MTQMLASVIDEAEAGTAIAGGADIIDLKDPGLGPLAAFSASDLKRTAAAIRGRRIVSAACGDLPMQPDLIRARAEEVAATGVDLVMVGFRAEENSAACAWALGQLASRHRLIAGLFADRGPPFELLPILAEHGFHGVMFDTADKANGRLLDHLPPQRVQDLLDQARTLGLVTGLGGSLEAPDIPRLLPFEPTFLAFRAALSDGARSDTIDPDAVARIRALIPEEQPSGRTGQVDYRLLTARGRQRENAAPPKTDRIFVRDFILPVEIGAYSFEHGHTQKVRFDVSADVLRTVAHPEDMRHVFSYDVILDGIRSIVAHGHVELVETLAEQVAALALRDPRVMRITVRVEKLELGPGGVGVEIERTREDFAAQRPPVQEAKQQQPSAAKKGPIS